MKYIWRLWLAVLLVMCVTSYLTTLVMISNFTVTPTSDIREQMNFLFPNVTKTLTSDIREKVDFFLNVKKPNKLMFQKENLIVPDINSKQWQSFRNVWLPTFYLMAYTPPARSSRNLDKVKESCIQLGCVAVTVEHNGWLAFFRNIPLNQTEWLPKQHATMWVLTEYLTDGVKQPDMKYGCSRHEHACRANYEEEEEEDEVGAAPCCATVMLEIMSDMSRVLRQYDIHWRLTQGQQLSVSRDGMLQLWDHDFDPLFEDGRMEEAKRIIDTEMHLAGGASTYRDADYFYTKKVAERQQTNWTRYTVMGGDFRWDLKEFHDPYTLQRNPTFMDMPGAYTLQFTPPTKDNTFPCLPGYDILCSKRWWEEAEFHSKYQRPLSKMPQEQIPYSGYKSARKIYNSLMFDEQGAERDEQSRANIMQEYISKCPKFWEGRCY